MQLARIMEDFLDFRSYVSHTLCQHRLFLGMSSPANARERLSDAYVWPLVHDEAELLCNMLGTLYGIVISGHPELESVVSDTRKTLKQMTTQQMKLINDNDDTAFGSFCNLARSLHNNLRDMYTSINNRTPDFSKDSVLLALENNSYNQWMYSINDHVTAHIAPILRLLLFDGDSKSQPDQYRKFWPLTSLGFLLTRKAVVAAAMDDIPVKSLVSIRNTQKLLRGIESVVSCWAPSIAESERSELIDNVIRAEGLFNRHDLIARLEGEAILG